MAGRQTEPDTPNHTTVVQEGQTAGKREQGCWSWPDLATQVLPVAALNCLLTNFRPSLLQAAPKQPPPAISGWHKKATYVRCMLLNAASFTSLCLSLWRRSEGEKRKEPGSWKHQAGAEAEESSSFRCHCGSLFTHQTWFDARRGALLVVTCGGQAHPSFLKPHLLLSGWFTEAQSATAPVQ